MACTYPDGDSATWCFWHRRDKEILDELKAREASERIVVLRSAPTRGAPAVRAR